MNQIMSQMYACDLEQKRDLLAYEKPYLANAMTIKTTRQVYNGPRVVKFISAVRK